MNEIVKAQPSLPLAKNDEAANVVDNVVDFWPDDGQPASLRRALTATEKKTLETRAVELVRVLRPISYASEEMKRAAQEIATLFLGFPSMRNIDAPTMVSAYVQHLSDLPIFAVRAAVEDVVRGRVKGLDPDWAPTSVRLHEVAQKHVTPIIEEQLRIEKTMKGVVPAPELTPEERDQIGQKFHAFAKDVTQKIERELSDTAKRTLGRISDADRAAQLREYERLGIEPQWADKAKTTLISPSLLKMINPAIFTTTKSKHRGG